jgi:hypothetical protein
MAKAVLNGQSAGTPADSWCQATADGVHHKLQYAAGIAVVTSSISLKGYFVAYSFGVHVTAAALGASNWLWFHEFQCSRIDDMILLCARHGGSAWIALPSYPWLASNEFCF